MMGGSNLFHRALPKIQLVGFGPGAHGRADPQSPGGGGGVQYDPGGVPDPSFSSSSPPSPPDPPPSPPSPL